jgi:hypothetical protein
MIHLVDRLTQITPIVVGGPGQRLSADGTGLCRRPPAG